MILILFSLIFCLTLHLYSPKMSHFLTLQRVTVSEAELFLVKNFLTAFFSDECSKFTGP